MGNLLKNDFLVTEPSDMKILIDFAYNNLNDDRIRISFGDCVGYYDIKSTAVMKKATRTENYYWQGCQAGKSSIGILHNGDILGCTSIRNSEFIEGNICERPLKSIWEDENSFLWNRTLKKEKLSGFCGKCSYGDICLGGCTNTRLCMEKDIYQSNRYCLYYQAIKEERAKLSQFNNINELILASQQLINKEKYQIAQIVLEHALSLDKNNLEVMKLLGYVNYRLQNYQLAKEINEEVLKHDNNGSYAHKGLGLSLCKLGETRKGLKHLYIAIDLCDENYGPLIMIAL